LYFSIKAYKKRTAELTQKNGKIIMDILTFDVAKKPKTDEER